MRHSVPCAELPRQDEYKKVAINTGLRKIRFKSGGGFNLVWFHTSGDEAISGGEQR